jgi:hypothetical protein
VVIKILRPSRKISTFGDPDVIEMSGRRSVDRRI